MPLLQRRGEASNHVGGHILRSLHGADDIKIKTYWKRRERAAAEGQETCDTD
jgi:hypothetical protein